MFRVAGGFAEPVRLALARDHEAHAGGVGGVGEIG
jgi:hypothetical protein